MWIGLRMQAPYCRYKKNQINKTFFFLTENDEYERKFRRWIEIAKYASQKLNKIWKTRKFNWKTNTKILIINCKLSFLLYGSGWRRFLKGKETWGNKWFCRFTLFLPQKYWDGKIKENLKNISWRDSWNF